MPANRKPRKAYRPRDVVPVPLAFGNSRDMLLNLGMRSRAAIDAVLAHEQEPRNLWSVESEIVAAMDLLDDASRRTDAHQFTGDSIAAARAELQRCGRAVMSIKARHANTGRIGCAGDERAALLSLGDLMDTLRDAMPRRMWFEAYRRSLTNSEITAKELAA